MGLTKPFELLNPPSSNFGDFCLVVNQIAGKKEPIALGESLINDLSKINYIKNVSIFSVKGKKKDIIYLNFSVAQKKKLQIQQDFIKSSLQIIFSSSYGQLEINKGKVAIVEHTSANPISPLHVGNLRNSIQGDTYARILERTGYTVYRHFYVNDVGLQISFVVIGYEILKKKYIRPPIKIDHWLGQIYAIMNNFYTIQSIKDKSNDLSFGKYSLTLDDVDKLSKNINQDLLNLNSKYDKINEVKNSSKKQKKELLNLKRHIKKKKEELRTINNSYQSSLNLERRFQKLYNSLCTAISKINLSEKTADYLHAYEKNTSSKITLLFKDVVNWIISAFQWTLKRYNIEFDQFDYESDVTASGLPDEIINKLANSTNIVPSEGKGVRYSYPQEKIDEFCRITGINRNELPIKGPIPDLQLRRSDGTALYAAKDIAYSIKKYKDRNPSVIYNVISSEQTLPQFQLLLPLFELDWIELASILKHYSYELVELRGRQMSGRLATYVTADEYYDETIIRTRIAKRESDKQRKKSLQFNEIQWEVENEMLRAVTLASTRFPLIETSPNRKIELDLDRELDFRRNSGPFVQYAHARASGIIRKIKNEKKIVFSPNISISLITTEEVIEIIRHLRDLNAKILAAYTMQDPSLIAVWCFQLAQIFMKFYENNPVLYADSENLLKARLTLIHAIRIGIATSLDILGIPAANQI